MIALACLMVYLFLGYINGIPEIIQLIGSVVIILVGLLSWAFRRGI